MAKQRPKKASGKKTRVAVGVGTGEGGYILVSDSERNKWKKVGPFLRKESVNCLRYDPKSKTLFAATHTNGVFVSKDFGKTWKPRNDGLHVKKTWTIEFDPHNKNTLYVGTHYGHLYKSVDLGKNWEEVSGLFGAPRRNEWGIDWGFGTVGLCVHTIKVDPTQKDRFYIVSSGMGPYRTDDAGKTWSLLDNGVKSTCSIRYSSLDSQGDTDPQRRLERHLEEVHKCTHKIAISARHPGTIYQQNHCGVYKSTDFGETWSDLIPGETLRHGFPIALVEGANDTNGGSVFIIPAEAPCKEHNSCVKGQLAVYRSTDGGNSWNEQTRGLPKKVHTCVLRDAMALDSLDNPGIYFGTTTGEVFFSTDLGDRWSKAFAGAGRIQGISAFTF